MKFSFICYLLIKLCLRPYVSVIFFMDGFFYHSLTKKIMLPLFLREGEVITFWEVEGGSRYIEGCFCHN